MTGLPYGRDPLRRLREQQAQAAQEPERRASLLEHVPPDAPMDNGTITVWNGQRFVAFAKWQATAPIATQNQPEEGPEERS